VSVSFALMIDEKL